MNYLRKLVSGKRRRFQDTQYDLDMTYITSRVIAMSFPSSGVESTYRNPIAKVAQYLDEKHEGKYWVFNCSERTYDKTHFHDRGSDFLWKDHHAPTLNLLFAMVKAMYDFLKKDDENVVVVHCNSGKGRTGTAIATLLFYTGFVQDMDDAMKYYGWKRFSSGIGVSQPCQLRSIYYFEAALRGVVVAPCAKRLKAIIFNQVPSISNDGCRPYFEMNNNITDEVLYTSKVDQTLNGAQIPPKFYSSISDQAMLFDFKEGLEPIISGDVHFLFKHKGVLSDTLICRIAFNTAFIPYNNTLNFQKYTVSPDKVKKDPKFNDNFIIKFIFEDVCFNCSKPWTMELDQYCEGCRDMMKTEILNWRSIHLSIAGRKDFTLEDGIKLHYRTHEENHTDKKDILALKLQFDSQNYKIKPPERGSARLTQQEDDLIWLKYLQNGNGGALIGKKQEEEEKKQEQLFSGFDLNNEVEVQDQYVFVQEPQIPVDQENQEDDGQSEYDEDGVAGEYQVIENEKKK